MEPPYRLPQRPKKKITRQAIWAAKQRALKNEGIETRGRKPWQCEKCHGAERWTDNEGKRHCHTCHPKTRERGRPKTPK